MIIIYEYLNDFQIISIKNTVIVYWRLLYSLGSFSHQN